MEPKTGRLAAAMVIFVPLCMAAVLVFPSSRAVFLEYTAAMPYLMGFLKFALLATTGEVLASKVAAGRFAFPKGVWAKAAVWGTIGLMLTLLMPVYAGGVAAVQASGLLPGKDSPFLTALFTSVLMNATFGVAMMAFHRITDTMIEQFFAEKNLNPMRAVRAVDWAGFAEAVVFRAIPLFWIPAHTVTFLLEPSYRVFLSAALSIVLGLLLAMAKRKK
ncbi:MAG: hypothetical protein LLF87_12195 [Eubacteriales bacterium]|nr:hypothetical protein [Eubacteriales bacterium]